MAGGDDISVAPERWWSATIFLRIGVARSPGPC